MQNNEIYEIMSDNDHEEVGKNSCFKLLQPYESENNQSLISIEQMLLKRPDFAAEGGEETKENVTMMIRAQHYAQQTPDSKVAYQVEILNEENYLDNSQFVQKENELEVSDKKNLKKKREQKALNKKNQKIVEQTVNSQNTLFHFDKSTFNICSLTLKDPSLFSTLDYTYLFKAKHQANPHSLSIVNLFTNDPVRHPVTIAFCVKPSGKFYMYQNGRMYDEIQCKGLTGTPFQQQGKICLGDLKYHTVTSHGRFNEFVIISGGVVNNDEISNKVYMFEFDINQKGHIKMTNLKDTPDLLNPRYGHAGFIAKTG